MPASLGSATQRPQYHFYILMGVLNKSISRHGNGDCQSAFLWAKWAALGSARELQARSACRRAGWVVWYNNSIAMTAL